MTARDEFDRRLEAWMTDAVGSPASDRFEQAVEATKRTRPLPRWLANVGSDWVGPVRQGSVERGPTVMRRELLVVAMIALLLGAAIGGALVGARLQQLQDDPLSGPRSDGLITFVASGDDLAQVGAGGLYVLSADGLPRRILGGDPTDPSLTCPAFSPDGTRLSLGRAVQTSDTTFRDAALVVADVDRDGNLSNARTTLVDGTAGPPCPVWSPDGRRIAMIVPAAGDISDGTGRVRVVTPDTGEIRDIDDGRARDLAWAPDGTQLAVVTAPDAPTMSPADGDIVLYPMAGREGHAVPGASAVKSVEWSPDGRRLAYERIKQPMIISADGNVVSEEVLEIWTISPDGGGRTLQSTPYSAFHGVGPVWSPTGDRIVFQRLCLHQELRPSIPCREQHEVVVLDPGTKVSETTPVGGEVVLPLVRTDGPVRPSAWFPYAVTWAPDGRRLFYDAWDEPISLNDSMDESRGLLSVDPAGVEPPVLLYAGRIQGATWGSRPGT